MKLNGRWTLLAALLGGLAIGSALMLTRRSERRLEAKRERKLGLHEWEGEGGSLAPSSATPAAT